MRKRSKADAVPQMSSQLIEYSLRPLEEFNISSAKFTSNIDIYQGKANGCVLLNRATLVITEDRRGSEKDSNGKSSRKKKAIQERHS